MINTLFASSLSVQIPSVVVPTLYRSQEPTIWSGIIATHGFVSEPCSIRLLLRILLLLSKNCIKALCSVFPALLLSRMFYNDIRLTENRIADIENDLDRNERKKLECVHLFNDKSYARNLTMVCL